MTPNYTAGYVCLSFLLFLWFAFSISTIKAGEIVDKHGTSVYSIQLYGKWIGAVAVGSFVVISSAIIAAKLTLDASKSSPSAV